MSAAEIYEDFFIPALFEPWPGPVAEAAGVAPGQRVLDVACGTGILARHVAERVGPEGSVVGLDVNDGMLAVARQKAPEIDWRQGAAEAIPFPDDHFDAVACQFGLMFFEDPVTAIREMLRVLRPGGRLAVAVWDTLERTPGYAAVTAMLERLFGEQVAGALRAPYSLGDVHRLAALFDEAGVPDAAVTTHPGMARFPSIASWMYTDIKGWTLADLVDDAQFDQLLQEAETVLHPFVTQTGTVAFSAPAHIVTVTR